MKKELTLLFDMDEVLVKLTKNVMASYNALHAPHLQVDWETIGKWENVPCPQCGRSFFDRLITSHKGIFRNCEPYQEYLDVFNEVINNDNYPFKSVGVVTRPVWKSVYCMNEKVDWLQQYSPKFDMEYNLFFTAAKSQLANAYTILVDDNLDNIKKFKKKGGIAVLVDRPHNREAIAADYDYKVSSGFELTLVLGQIIAKYEPSLEAVLANTDVTFDSIQAKDSTPFRVIDSILANTPAFRTKFSGGTGERD